MMQVQHRDLLCHVYKAGNAGGKLGQHRRPCGALHAHVEVLHKQDIQNDVHCHRGDQEMQRRAAVAQGAQHRRAQVIQHRRADAHEHDEDIAVCVFKDLRRGIHEPEQIVRPEKADQPDHRRDPEAEPHKLGCTAADALRVPCPEALGDGDGKAGAAARGKAQDQEVQRPRGAHGGKGIQAQDAAYQNAVRNIIELLKQVADQKRRAEAQDAFQRRTCRHFVCHNKTNLPKPRIWEAPNWLPRLLSPYFSPPAGKCKR